MAEDRVDHLLAAQVAERPDALALEDATGAAWSWSDLDVSARALGAELRAQGVMPKDRVLIMIENCAAAVAALFACWQIGAVPVPVNARQSGREIDRIAAHAAPRVLLFTTEVSPDATTHAARCDAAPLHGVWGQLAIAQGSGDDVPCAPDTAVVLYTTGTTGAPKGVMLSHANLRFGAATSVTFRGMTSRDLIYGVLPITHVFGLCSILVAAVHVGCTLRLIPRFDVSAVFEGLRRGITLFSGVPQMHALLMAHAAAQGLEQLGSDTLRFVSSGAAPLDPAWKRKAEAFYGVALQNGYGMTESTAGIAVTHNALGDPDISVGPALPGVELRIDEDVPGGGDGTGEVLARGGHVMTGYFRNPEATAAVLNAEGWLRTGDLGRMDDQGRLHIVGRCKELIIHGGFNVYPPEVEAVLSDHPGVVQAAVIGRARAGDEEVLAFVQIVPGAGVQEAELRAYVAERLVGYKRPSTYVFADSLPAAPTGKILKHKLIAVFADRLD
ncbi:class I adenylate-forming enzyme family protein [uncultured Tateyamaria sp.]|uniref:class I adenylate-forming enzyme family protein n=1 Tax=uncultured Tateyamaria sp. TaxID=455651 RepID=UPI0026078F71|nr:class I adenylate-forming enzyme family protein [uncultured Tateyamaria sp.]